MSLIRPLKGLKRLFKGIIRPLKGLIRLFKGIIRPLVKEGGKSLERKISELIAAQSQFQFECAAAQSKLQADCAINSTRILEMTSVQEKNIATSAVNAASLLETPKNFNESLTTLASCIEAFKVSQTELRLEIRSNSEGIKYLNEKQTGNGLLVATVANQTAIYQSGETYTHDESPATPMVIDSAASNQSGETYNHIEGPTTPMVDDPATSNQSWETYTHIEDPATPMVIGSAASSQSGETHIRAKSPASGHPNLYSSTASSQGELANPQTKFYKDLYNGVSTKQKLVTRNQSSFQSGMTPTEDCPISVLNSGNENHTQSGETQSNDS